MFEVHKLNDVGMTKAGDLRDRFEGLLADLEAICGTAGREMSIVRTKLEEASFFAKRAMAMDPANQTDVVA